MRYFEHNEAGSIAATIPRTGRRPESTENIMIASQDTRQFCLSAHAEARMHERGVSLEAIELAFAHGRRTHVRGACYFSIGRTEIRQHRERCPEIARHHGLHVVTRADGTILTVYKNRGFRILRPSRGPQWVPQQWSAP